MLSIFSQRLSYIQHCLRFPTPRKLPSYNYLIIPKPASPSLRRLKPLKLCKRQQLSSLWWRNNLQRCKPDLPFPLSSSLLSFLLEPSLICLRISFVPLARNEMNIFLPCLFHVLPLHYHNISKYTIIHQFVHSCLIETSSEKDRAPTGAKRQSPDVTGFALIDQTFKWLIVKKSTPKEHQVSRLFQQSDAEFADPQTLSPFGSARRLRLCVVGTGRRKTVRTFPFHSHPPLSPPSLIAVSRFPRYLRTVGGWFTTLLWRAGWVREREDFPMRLWE